LDATLFVTGSHRRARRLHVPCALLACSALSLAGCTSIQQTIGGWFGPAATPTPLSTPQDTAARAAATGVFYAGAEGLNVYSEPSGSSKVIAELPLYDKITRSKRERGYAYVTSAKSGVSGWVDNAQLLWQIPSLLPPTAGASPAAPPEEIVPTPESPPVTPAAVATSPQPPALAPPTPTPTGIAPSMFDAY
jgi:hypothetical protein